MNIDLHLSDTVDVVVDKKIEITISPRWMFDGRKVILGPYHTADEHEKHVSQTTGSMEWLWSDTDEIRFAKTTLALQSMMLNVPDASLAQTEILAIWQKAPINDGSLQLRQAQDFQIEPTRWRWMDQNSEVLTCFLPRALDDAKQRLRLRLAQDIEILFADTYYCGWSLHHTARYIVDAWEEPSGYDVDDKTTKLIYDYLSLVTDPYIEKMEDQDEVILQKLLDLSERTEVTVQPH
ncbi:hypothetical protein KDW_40460 [Dictyobacter vulcani]|uniref:Uncharacterized protein n=1 Tax=Dictyobacter vulcani TaxID=2607529 RepID=A0A5J4KK66_9CHLR|nr:hypothetical protein [Dictyobacter vulcani]GER89884.1 hypothetical protein KDW_40460 [Dictyobacter vulcani]